MAEHERATQNKQTEVDQKHRVRQKESEPSFDQFHTWVSRPFSLTETPFVPQMDKHAESLAMSPSDEARANLVLHLQQTYGNKYVKRLIESRAVQAKLTVNAPNDIYEQEADRVADAVTRTIAPSVQQQEEEEEEVRTQSVEEEEELQMKTSRVQRQEVPEAEEEIQMQPAEEEVEEVQAQSVEGQPATVSEYIEARINNARGSGHPLSDNVREPMEHAFEVDFSDVRVHTDSEANLLSHQLSARAFTTARDIFFRQGEYSPSSDTGKKLIAHELTHVVQQNRIEEKRGTKLRRQVVRNKDKTTQEKGELQGEVLTTREGIRHIRAARFLSSGDLLLMRIPTQTQETNVSDTVKNSAFKGFGLTWPEKIGGTLEVRYKKNKETGKFVNLRADVKALKGYYSVLSRLKEGMVEPPDAPNEDQWNIVIGDLAALGVHENKKATYYMKTAVRAHENVHVPTIIGFFSDDSNKIAKMINNKANKLWQGNTYDNIGEAVGVLKNSDYLKAAKPTPGGSAFYPAGGNSPCYVWSSHGKEADAKDHQSGNCDNAERAIVVPKMEMILKHAKSNKWIAENKWRNKVGCYKPIDVEIDL